MTENSSDTEKLKHTRVDFIEAGNQGSRHRREPSFSRWCDEEGRIQVDTPLKNADSSVQDIDFELPLLQLGRFVNRQFEEERNGYLKFQQTIMQSSDGETQVQFPIHIEGNESEKFEPLDIEKNSGRDNNGDNCESFQSGKYNSLQPDAKNPLSTAIVLKILFFIIVWYTFSLFLTLYNKSLLGDHLGRFPAPLLMNTVHFTMQAVSSNFITWFWSARFQPHVTMTWRDYFMKVVPTALGTALDINLSNASLVSISVTFATMCKSGSPIFLLLFAFAFRLETPSFKLSGIILIISVGILLTVLKETEFEFWGFVFVMLASVMSGFRWSMTQILLQFFSLTSNTWIISCFYLLALDPDLFHSMMHLIPNLI